MGKTIQPDNVISGFGSKPKGRLFHQIDLSRIDDNDLGSIEARAIPQEHPDHRMGLRGIASRDQVEIRFLEVSDGIGHGAGA
jgi:hypothetical protein